MQSLRQQPPFPSPAACGEGRLTHGPLTTLASWQTDLLADRPNVPFLADRGLLCHQERDVSYLTEPLLSQRPSVLDGGPCAHQGLCPYSMMSPNSPSGLAGVGAGGCSPSYTR